MSQIKLERIPQKELRDFIRQQLGDDTTSFDHLSPTYRPGDDLGHYYYHEKEYHLNRPKNQLWDHYLSINPGLAWNGKMLSFGLMASKKDREVMYVGDSYRGIAVGQVLFLRLEVLGGLIKLPVAHEVIAVDHEKSYLEVSYVKGGKSAGKQRISFYEKKDGSTRINHSTYYRSTSDFRDRLIYPYFHTRAINEYHRNVIRALPGDDRSV